MLPKPELPAKLPELVKAEQDKMEAVAGLHELDAILDNPSPAAQPRPLPSASSSSSGSEEESSSESESAEERTEPVLPTRPKPAPDEDKRPVTAALVGPGTKLLENSELKSSEASLQSMQHEEQERLHVVATLTSDKKSQGTRVPSSTKLGSEGANKDSKLGTEKVETKLEELNELVLSDEKELPFWEVTALAFLSIHPKPKMTEKLLRKPPFRFIHDIFSATKASTGFGEGLFSGKELDARAIGKDDDAKKNFITKLILLVEQVNGDKVAAEPCKIVAGWEAEKTNEFLQDMADAALSEVDMKPHVNAVLRGIALKNGKNSTFK